MTRFATQTFAAIAAVLIVAASMIQLVTVPPAETVTLVAPILA